MNKKLKITLALGVATLLFTGCGGGSDTTTPPTSEGVTISGTLDTGLASSVTGIERGIFGSRTKMVVLTNGGNTNKTYDVATDGSFSIPTSEISGNDMVIIAVDDDTKEVLGNLKLSTTTNDKLDFVDKSKLTNSLNFGTIDSSLNTNQTIANSNAFSSADIETLQTVARADDALVLAQNAYRNPNIDAEIQILYNMTEINNIIGEYSSYLDFNSSNIISGGARPTIGTELTEFNNIDYTALTLYPPISVNALDRFTNTYSERNSTTPLNATYKGTNYGNFYEFEFVDNFPAGDWILKANGVEKGKFVFNGAYPLDADGKPIMPVPSIRLNMDTNDNTKIKSIDVQWYIFNGQTYVEASNAVMSSVASQDTDKGVFIAPLRSNYGQDIGVFKNDTWNGNYTMDDSSSVSLPSETHTRRIEMSYYIGQVSHQFLFQ